MRISGVASAIPENGVSNEDLEARLKLERGWIERRTGILHRPTAPPNVATSDLAVLAGTRALEKAGIPANDIGFLLLATSTPDHLLPPTAPLVAHRLGLAQVGAADMAAACAGFVYALIFANAYGQSIRKPILVIAANILTRRVNERDPATACLFSDGAGAVVLAPSDESHLLGSYLGSDGEAYDGIFIPGGGTREPLTHGGLDEGRNLMTLRRGSAFFRKAVHNMTAAGKAAMMAANLDADAVSWWIPHQANGRMIEDAGRLLNIPPPRTINVVERYGNSSAATIPIALAHAVEAGRVQNGNVLLLTAVGAGMLNAAAVLRW